MSTENLAVEFILRSSDSAYPAAVEITDLIEKSGIPNAKATTLNHRLTIYFENSRDKYAFYATCANMDEGISEQLFGKHR